MMTMMTVTIHEAFFFFLSTVYIELMDPTNFAAFIVRFNFTLEQVLLTTVTRNPEDEKWLVVFLFLATITLRLTVTTLFSVPISLTSVTMCK